MCTTLEKQVGSYTKATNPSHNKKLLKLCRDSKFLSMFCPGLEKLLKPIYNLTRKGRPFLWGEEQKDSLKGLNAD